MSGSIRLGRGEVTPLTDSHPIAISVHRFSIAAAAAAGTKTNHQADI